jgi:hypothetical protein
MYRSANLSWLSANVRLMRLQFQQNDTVSLPAFSYHGVISEYLSTSAQSHRSLYRKLQTKIYRNTLSYFLLDMIFNFSFWYQIMQYNQVSVIPWLIITGIALNDWIYWHFYYNYSQLQSPVTAHNRWLSMTRSIPSWTTSVYPSTVVDLHKWRLSYEGLFADDSNTTVFNDDWLNCLSLILQPTVSRPVCLGTKQSSVAYDQIFITVRQLRVC